MTSTALVKRYPYDMANAIAWLDSVVRRPLTSHYDVLITELELRNLSQELDCIDNGYDPDIDNESPATMCLWHAFNLYYSGAHSRTKNRWSTPLVRLSAQSAALACWVKFFPGSPIWKPTLFECTANWDHRDIRSFLRLSRVSTRHPSDYMPWHKPVPAVAPYWFYQMLATSCEDSLAGSRLRTQEGLHYDCKQYVGAPISVPADAVLSAALSLWTPLSPEAVYKSLAAAVTAAQRLQ